MGSATPGARGRLRGSPRDDPRDSPKIGLGVDPVSQGSHKDDPHVEENPLSTSGGSRRRPRNSPFLEADSDHKDSRGGRHNRTVDSPMNDSRRGGRSMNGTMRSTTGMSANSYADDDFDEYSADEGSLTSPQRTTTGFGSTARGGLGSPTGGGPAPWFSSSR